MGVVVVSSMTASNAAASIFTWQGSAIVGEDPGFTPEGSADFTISGTTLTITLTDNSSQTLKAIGQVLTGLT